MYMYENLGRLLNDEARLQEMDLYHSSENGAKLKFQTADETDEFTLNVHKNRRSITASGVLYILAEDIPEQFSDVLNDVRNGGGLGNDNILRQGPTNMIYAYNFQKLFNAVRGMYDQKLSPRTPYKDNGLEAVISHHFSNSRQLTFVARSFEVTSIVVS